MTRSAFVGDRLESVPMAVVSLDSKWRSVAISSFHSCTRTTRDVEAFGYHRVSEFLPPRTHACFRSHHFDILSTAQKSPCVNTTGSQDNKRNRDNQNDLHVNEYQKTRADDPILSLLHTDIGDCMRVWTPQNFTLTQKYSSAVAQTEKQQICNPPFHLSANHICKKPF